MGDCGVAITADVGAGEEEETDDFLDFLEDIDVEDDFDSGFAFFAVLL